MTENNGNKDLATTAPAELPAINSPGDIYFNLQLFDHVQRVARMFAESSMVPDRYKRKIGDCTIALSMAQRLKADPIMVMQNIYIVHGSPGMEGKMVIALINQCGKFSQLLFDEDKDNNGDVVKCTARASLRETGETITTELTWKEVLAHKWDKNPKWTSMRAQMFRYRAAAFFARTFCPEVLFGMQTTEELHDIIDVTPDTSSADHLNELIGQSTVNHSQTASEVLEEHKENIANIDQDDKTVIDEPGDDVDKTEPAPLNTYEVANRTKEDGELDSDDNTTSFGEILDPVDTTVADELAEIQRASERHHAHPFNKKNWINIKSAGGLKIHVKNNAEFWEGITQETKQEFYGKWKRILKAGAVEAWPFEDMEAAPAQEAKDDGQTAPPEIEADTYINQFKLMDSKESLQEYFKDNNTSILNHSEKDRIIAEYDRLMDANEEAPELKTAQDFLKHIYHATKAGDLSYLQMVHVDTIDALPEKNEIWSRVDEKLNEFNQAENM